MTDKKTGLELLREPFPAHQISKLPKPFKKDSPKGNCPECGGYHGLPAMHLDYVGHAALTDRLLDADPAWSWEPVASGPDGLPAFDKSAGLWIRLTVCGVTRLGYGNAEGKPYMDAGAREKEVIGDALRNAAMRFGAALDLWHKGELHANKGEEKPEVANKADQVEQAELMLNALRSAAMSGKTMLEREWKAWQALSDTGPITAETFDDVWLKNKRSLFDAAKKADTKETA